mmetsp:Transcript_24140/g.37083  ORF Transcript_24140/g.37083 Transcript_24140/m.37083 type:complete len:88 (-) Transcript_24140:653-916(-)
MNQMPKKSVQDFLEEGWVENDCDPIKEEAGEEGSHRGSRHASPVRSPPQSFRDESSYHKKPSSDDYGQEELLPKSANQTDLRAPSSI